MSTCVQLKMCPCSHWGQASGKGSQVMCLLLPCAEAVFGVTFTLNLSFLGKYRGHSVKLAEAFETPWLSLLWNSFPGKWLKINKKKYFQELLAQWSPAFLAPGTGFIEDNFSMGRSWGDVSGWFQHITFTSCFVDQFLIVHGLSRSAALMLGIPTLAIQGRREE